MKFATGYHDAMNGRAMVAVHGEEYASGYRKGLLEQAAAAIKAATNLRELLDALIEFEDSIKILDGSDEVDGTYLDEEWELKSRGIDICSLPTFGGREPQSTAEVWSWDEKRILTGVGSFHDWEIRELDDEDRLPPRQDAV